MRASPPQNGHLLSLSLILLPPVLISPLYRFQKFHQLRLAVWMFGIPLVPVPFWTAIAGMFRRFRPAYQMQVRCCKIPFSCCRIFLGNQLGSVIKLVPVIPDSDVSIFIPQSPGLVISQPFLPLVIILHWRQLWLFLWFCFFLPFLLRQKLQRLQNNAGIFHNWRLFLFWRVLKGCL